MICNLCYSLIVALVLFHTNTSYVGCYNIQEYFGNHTWVFMIRGICKYNDFLSNCII